MYQHIPLTDAAPGGVSASSSAGSSAEAGGASGFSNSYGYDSSYAYNQQIPATNNAQFLNNGRQSQQQHAQFGQNLPAIPFAQFPVVSLPQFGGNVPLPPLLTPEQFSEALNQYVTSVQKQYAK